MVTLPVFQMNKQERNTPKWDIWFEAYNLISQFGEPNSDVWVEAAESLDFERLVLNGYGADKNETQEDRDRQLEGCINSFDEFIEIHKKLGELIQQWENLNH